MDYIVTIASQYTRDTQMYTKAANDRMGCDEGNWVDAPTCEIFMGIETGLFGKVPLRESLADRYGVCKAAINLTPVAKMRYAVIGRYSFDTNCSVKLFPTEPEAIKYLKETVEGEDKQDTENGNDHEVKFESDCYAKIINHRRSGDTDISEWSVTDI